MLGLDGTQTGVLLYMLATLLLGIWAGKDIESGEDFMVAGRHLPRWLCTFTLFATWFGGGTCLGAAGKVYQHGLLGAIIDPLGAALCLVLSAAFFFRTMRRYRFLTICDFYRARYGPWTEFLTSLCMIPAYLGWIASQLVAFAYVLTSLTAFDLESAIVAGAAIVLLYTALGGMWAVAVTDFAQAVVLILGLLLLLPVAWQAAGGWAVLSALPRGHLDLLPTGGAVAWSWYLHSWVVIGLGDLPSQGLMSRAMSAEDDAAAAQAGYAAAALYLSVGLVPVVLGLLGSVLVPELGNPEHVLLAVARNLLPPLGMAVFAGALISALMSSADSALLALASVVVENLVVPWKGRLAPRNALRACQAVVVVAALAATALALRAQNVFELMVSASAVGLVGLAASFVAGLYWPRANTPGAIASILVGMFTWVSLEVLRGPAPGPPSGQFPHDLVAAGASVLALVLVSLATGSRVPPRVLPDPAAPGSDLAAPGQAPAAHGSDLAVPCSAPGSGDRADRSV